jgi:hypothetical protein
MINCRIMVVVVCLSMHLNCLEAVSLKIENPGNVASDGVTATKAFVKPGWLNSLSLQTPKEVSVAHTIALSDVPAMRRSDLQTTEINAFDFEKISNDVVPLEALQDQLVVDDKVQVSAEVHAITTKQTVVVNPKKKVGVELFVEDVTAANLAMARELMQAIKTSGTLKNNNTLGQAMLHCDPTDINQSYALAEGFADSSSRLTIQVMFNKLTGSLKQGKSINVVKFKQQFAKDLIQKQLDNNLGVDANSFQSLFSLPIEIQTQLENRFTDATGKYKDLFDPKATKTSIEKLQLIADMNDEVMNVISGSVAQNEKGIFISDKDGNLQLAVKDNGIATFKTVFDASGNCISTISSSVAKGDKLVLTSIIDNAGKPKSRGLCIGDDEFTTTFTTGWVYGNYKTVTLKSAHAAKPIELNSVEGQVLSNCWMLNKASIFFKTTVKVALSAGKQGAIYALSSLLPYHIPLAAAALLLPFVKIISILPAMHQVDAQGNEILDEQSNPKIKTLTGFQFTGHQWSDPAALLVAKKAIDIAVGDNGQLFGGFFSGGKALLSGEGNRVFRQGTWISNGLNKIQGKASEVENVNETYVEAIPSIIQAVFAPLQALFPQTLGKQILSKADLKQSISSDVLTSANDAAIYPVQISKV